MAFFARVDPERKPDALRYLTMRRRLMVYVYCTINVALVLIMLLLLRTWHLFFMAQKDTLLPTFCFRPFTIPFFSREGGATSTAVLRTVLVPTRHNVYVFSSTEQTVS